MPVYIDREAFDSWNAAAIDEQAKRVKEDIAAAPPLPSVESPPPPPAPAQPTFQPPTPSDAQDRLSQRAVSPPPLTDLLAAAGLAESPSPSAGGAATGAQPGAAPAPSGGIPSLDSLLQSAGLGDVGGAVSGAAQTVASAAPPPLADLMRSAGLLDQPKPPVQQPAPVAATTAPGGGLAPNTAGRPSQFQIGLSDADAYAACGPAAAIAFARAYGRNPTGPEALELARQVGWTQQQGMAGVQSEKALLDKMGIATRLEQGVDWNHVTQDALNGNPIVLDTPGHYYFIDGSRQRSDGTQEYHVGTSGTDLRGGREWMTSGEINGMPQSGGAVRAALYADNPQTPHPSVANASQSATQTTAGLSGGGALSGQIGERGQQIMSGAAQAASWLGDQGQKALQAVLMTEGGLNNARGDNGQSVGPLQFYTGGQLANLAQQMGMGLEQAKTWVEQNPVAAVQWAIGTPDKPGYLGAAIQKGLQAGLQGADLATYAQRHGQVSVSPERAGANFAAMFGGGQGVIQGAAGAVQGAGQAAQSTFADLAQSGGNLASQGAALAQGLTRPLGESPTAAVEREATQRMAALQDTLNTTLQGGQQAQDQRSVQASTLGGGLAGRSAVNVTDAGGGLTPEQIAGDTTLPVSPENQSLNAQIRGPLGPAPVIQQPPSSGAADATLDAPAGAQSLGAASQMFPTWSQDARSAVLTADMPRGPAQGTPVPPADYTNASLGRPAEPPKPLWQQIGDTIGSAISQGLQPLVQAFQGTAANPPPPEGGGYGAGGPLPAPTVTSPALPQPSGPPAIVPEGGGYGATGLAPVEQTGPIGQAAIGAGQIAQQVQTPEADTVPLGAVGQAIGTGASALGTVLHAGQEAIRQVSPVSGAARTVAGSDEYARQYAALGGADLEREYRNLVQRRLDGEQGLEPRIQQIGDQLNTINAQITQGQPYEAAISQAAEQNPSFPAIETAANVGAAGLALPLAAEGAPLAARVLAEVLQPGTNPLEVARGAFELVRGADAADPGTEQAVRAAWESFGQRWSDSAAQRERMLSQIGDPRGFLERVRDNLASVGGAVARGAQGVLEDISRPTRGGVVGEAPAAANADRFYHGTGADFPRPDAARFEPNGLFGPGYYVTSDPRVAGGDVALGGEFSIGRGDRQVGPHDTGAVISPGYAQTALTTLDRPALEDAFTSTANALTEQGASGKYIGGTLLNDLMGRRQNTFSTEQVAAMIDNADRNPRFRPVLDELRKQLGIGAGPNVRAVDVPKNLNLFNVDTPVTPDVVHAIADQLPEASRQTFINRVLPAENTNPMLRINQRGRGPATGEELYRVLDDLVPFDQQGQAPANRILSRAGFDGIEYAGGKRVPMADGTGQPIEHTARVIFPESLDKLTNATAGTRGGLLPDVAGENLARQVATRAAVGGTGAGIQESQDPNATPGDVARAAVQGAVLGGVRPLIGRAIPGLRIAPEVGRIARAIGDPLERFGLSKEPVEGQTPLSDDDLLSHFGGLQQRYEANDVQIARLEDQLHEARNPGVAPIRPQWAVGIPNESLIKIANDRGVSPYQEDWWEQAGLSTGSGELRRLLREGGIRGVGTQRFGGSQLHNAQAELDRLKFENQGIMDHVEQITAADSGTLYRAPAQRAELPFAPPTNAVESSAGAASVSADLERAQAAPISPAEAVTGSRGVAETPPAGATAGAEAPRATTEPAVTPQVAPETQAASMLQDMLDEAQRRGGDPETLATMQARLDGLKANSSRLTGRESLGPSGPQPGQLPLGAEFGQELPTVAPISSAAQEARGPSGFQPGQAPLPGVEAPTPIHPRIQQLLGGHPEYAQIAQDGLNDLQAAKADPATVARYFAAIERSSGLPSGVDANAWFRALRNGSMAGGLQTLGHVALNIPLQVLWSAAREPVAAVFRGQLEQIPAALVGLFKGHAAAAEDALQQLRYGITAADAAAGGTARTVVDANGVARSVMTAANSALPPTIALRTGNRALQTVANVLSGTVGTHGAAQTYIQRLGFYQKATELAWSQAKREGLSGSQFSARAADIVNHITEPQYASLLTEANNYGDRMALRGAQGAVGSTLRGIAGAGIGGNLLIPFETIANKVLTSGIEATPGIGALGAGIDAAASRIGRGPYAPGARDVARGAVTPLSERLANQVLGIGVTAMGMGLAAQGILKGAGPSNPQERATALDNGEQFDGINMGNTFIPGHMLGRLWYPLALAANTVEAQKYAKQGATPEEMIQDAIQRTGTFFENETFLRQFGDLAAALKDPSGKLLENFAASQVESLIPQNALMRDVGSAGDPTARVAAPGANPLEAIGNRIGAQAPIIRQDQPPRINATTGQDTPNRSGILGSFLHPKLADDPVATEALRLQMAGQSVGGLSSPKANYLGGTQTPEQLTAAQRAVGSAVQLYATNILNDPRYATLTDAQKADALSGALSLAGKVANVQLGSGVSRGPHEAALLQWAQTPQYAGVSSRLPPEQIATANLQIEEAKAKMAAYQKQYKDLAENRLRRDDPTAYRLSQRDRIDKEVLDRKKKAIDKATGGALTQAQDKATTGGLVGAGSTVLGP